VTEGRLFVLRVWSEHGCLRATLRAVEEPEARRFDDVQRLCSHIAAVAGDAVATAPGQPLGDEGTALARER
jgi:hypothetical protein